MINHFYFKMKFFVIHTEYIGPVTNGLQGCILIINRNRLIDIGFHNDSNAYKSHVKNRIKVITMNIYFK